MQPPLYLIALDAGVAAEVAAAIGPEAAPARLGALHEFEARLEAEPQACAVVAVADAADLEISWWRALRAARAPQAELLVACRACSDESWRRWLVAGARNVVRPPFTGLDLRAELASETALSRVFRRHEALAAHGKTMFRYSLPSDPQLIPGVVHFVALLAMEFGFDPVDYTMNLPLALDEALSNAIVHGNRGDVRKRVEVEGSIDAGLLRLKVRDEGDGFRRESAPNPVDPGRLMAPSGRGLFLIESVMDEVRFSQDGRCIEMQKRVRPAGRDGA